MSNKINISLETQFKKEKGHKSTILGKYCLNYENNDVSRTQESQVKILHFDIWQN